MEFRRVLFRSGPLPMHQTQWSAERPLPPPVSLTSQSHHEKPPEVTCTSRGTPGCPASTRERPRETFFNTSRGQMRSAERQVQQVENFIAQKVDAIILNPCEVEASSPAVDRALAAGIPIVNVNSETKTAPTAFVGSRDEESARLAMGFIAQRLGGKGDLVMMQGFLGQAAQIKRDQGARDVLAREPGLKLLAEQTAEWDRAKAMTLMENWIQ